MCLPGSSQNVVPAGLWSVRSLSDSPTATAIAPAGFTLGPARAADPHMGAGGAMGHEVGPPPEPPPPVLPALELAVLAPPLPALVPLLLAVVPLALSPVDAL